MKVLENASCVVEKADIVRNAAMVAAIAALEQVINSVEIDNQLAAQRICASAFHVPLRLRVFALSDFSRFSARPSAAMLVG